SPGATPSPYTTLFRSTGQATYRGVGAISCDQQRCAQLATIGEGQQPVVSAAAQLFQARPRQQTDLAVVQAIEQGVLHHTVLDDMTKGLGMYAGRSEVDAAGARAVPHAHLAIGAGASCGNTLPGAQTFENALAGHRQGADARLERRLRIERRYAERAAVDDQDVQAAVFKRQGQGTADHSGADDDQIRSHIHSLAVRGFACPYPLPAGRTSAWPVATGQARAGPGCARQPAAAGHC